LPIVSPSSPSILSCDSSHSGLRTLLLPYKDGSSISSTIEIEYPCLHRDDIAFLFGTTSKPNGIFFSFFSLFRLLRLLGSLFVDGRWFVHVGSFGMWNGER